MTAGYYPCPFQTALDDTIGAEAGVSVKLIEGSADHKDLPHGVIGHVRMAGLSESSRRLFDTSLAAPDIGHMPMDNRYLWVHADSCRYKSGHVVRRLAYSEVLSLWDYEGKLE